MLKLTRFGCILFGLARNVVRFWYFAEQRPQGTAYNVDKCWRGQTPPAVLMKGNLGDEWHVAERYSEGRNYKKSCHYCRKIGVTTNSGHTVETQWKCEQCGVALCINKRNCFALFHEKLLKDSQG
jgi:hypothetical protein